MAIFQFITAQPARAEDAANGSQLEEVVVTAARRTSTVLATPINISAATGEELTKAGVEDFRDLSRVTPGLVYNASSIRSGGATNNFVLHGLNLDDVSRSSDFPLPTVAPVSIYVGETPMLVSLHLADIQRVEVLRGPQSSLYGSASIAGTVRVLFNPPDLTTRSAKISTMVSQTKHADAPNYSADGVFNQPLTDTLAVRIAAGYSFEHGFIEAPNRYLLDKNGMPVLANPGDPVHSLPVSVARKDINDAEQWYIRPTLLYQKDDLRVLFTYQHQHEYAAGDAADSYGAPTGPSSYTKTVNPNYLGTGFDAAFPIAVGQYETGNFLEQPYNRDVDVGSVEVAYEMGFATLISATSVYDNTSHAIADSSGGYQTSFGYLYGGYPRMPVASRRGSNDRAFVQEMRLVSKGDGPLSYTVGAFYMDQKSHLIQDDIIIGYAAFSQAAFGVPSTDFGYRFDRDIEFKDMAAFGELTYQITPKWQVTGGGRLYRQDLDLFSTVLLPICGRFCSNDGIDPLGRAGGGDRQKSTKVLGKLNTSYKINDDLLTFFTFSQGQRRGGANGVPTKGPLSESADYLFFKPDSVDNFEVGLKGHLGSRIQFSSAAYWINWDNPQVNISTPVGGYPAVVNGSKARSLGIDLEGRMRLTDEVTVGGTYSYNKATLRKAILVGGRSYGADGQRLPGTPAHTANLSADYDKVLSDDISMVAHVDANYRSGMTTSLTPRRNVDLSGFTTLNASVGVRRGDVQASIFADNITNVRGVLSQTAAAATDARYINNRVMQPLTVGVRLGYQFQ